MAGPGATPGPAIVFEEPALTAPLGRSFGGP
jgi:hypothetical protein